MLKNSLISILGIMGLILPHAEAAEQATLDAGMTNPGYHEKPEWFKNSFLDIREDISEASNNKRRVMLYFYQDGCPYCAKLLRDNLAQKQLADKTRNAFDVIAINMWGDREVTDLQGENTTEKKFSEKLKVMYTPTLVFLDEQGQVVLRLNGYYPPHKFEAALDYVSSKTELKKVAFRDYLQHQVHVVASGKLHNQDFIISPPYNLKTIMKNNRPLLVMFEQKECSVCDEYHSDIYKRKETRALLKGLNVIRLDMWGNEKITTPEGMSVTAAEWARQLDIKYAPSLVYFDGQKEVFRTEAYLRAFHLQSTMDYVASRAYRKQENFQRYIAGRADALEAQGIHVDLWK